MENDKSNGLHVHILELVLNERVLKIYFPKNISVGKSNKNKHVRIVQSEIYVSAKSYFCRFEYKIARLHLGI